MTDPVTAQPTRDQLSRRAGHILFTQGPEQPAATARETCVLLDDLAATEKRATRAEAQSAIRGRAVAIYQQRAREAEARVRDLTQEVRDERGAARDQMEQVRIRDERIWHLEDTARVLVKEALNAEAERDSARGYISELETAVQSRNEVIKHRDARIKAVEDVLEEQEAHFRAFWAANGKPDAPTPGIPVADIRRALDGDA